MGSAPEWRSSISLRIACQIRSHVSARRSPAAPRTAATNADVNTPLRTPSRSFSIENSLARHADTTWQVRTPAVLSSGPAPRVAASLRAGSAIGSRSRAPRSNERTVPPSRGAPAAWQQSSITATDDVRAAIAASRPLSSKSNRNASDPGGNPGAASKSTGTSASRWNVGPSGPFTTTHLPCPE